MYVYIGYIMGCRKVRSADRLRGARSVFVEERAGMKGFSEPHVLKWHGVRRVFLAHDNAMVREGIRHAIEAQEEMVVCGETGGGQPAFEGIAGTDPDAVVVDILQERGSGLRFIREIRKRAPKTAILVVTMQNERIYCDRALRAGAAGYLMNPETIEEVINALKKVLRGRIYVSEAMANRILFQRIQGADEIPPEPTACLSDRELEVFRLIGEWKPTREIAARLQISVKTVEYYRDQIKKKLGLRTAGELGRAATSWVMEARESDVSIS